MEGIESVPSPLTSMEGFVIMLSSLWYQVRRGGGVPDTEMYRITYSPSHTSRSMGKLRMAGSQLAGSPGTMAVSKEMFAIALDHAYPPSIEAGIYCSTTPVFTYP